MANNLYNTIYNPDVLSCIANLSNDEVFTPPEIANKMLDLLPQELFSNPNTTFLDPACKSGVFLREIAKRLLKGLEKKIPDLQERTNHIFKKQLFGIAITELTSHLSRRSVYCSKTANGNYSVVDFDTVDGNIRFKSIEHTWYKGKCKFCGAPKEKYDRGDELESYAYEFIHAVKPEEIFKMKFDVIISNPPYQLEDGGFGKSARPIYNWFVEKAKQLVPSYIVMIIPSKWFTGGKGLETFRSDMLHDRRIRQLVDYENFRDVFPGVDLAGGACYFLWDKGYNGPCVVENRNNTKESSVTTRFLDEYEIFIRQNLAISIVNKVKEKNKGKNFLNTRISASKPFGMRTFYEPRNKGVPCWFMQRVGLKFASPSDVVDSNGYLNKWKFLIPRSPIAGQTDFSKPVAFYYDGNTRIAKPGECCTETYLVAGAFKTKAETLAFKSYIMTKTVRFLLLQTVVSQDVTRKNFCFIPDLEKYTGTYTDEMLCKMWDISDEEYRYIKSRIGEIGSNASQDDEEGE